MSNQYQEIILQTLKRIEEELQQLKERVSNLENQRQRLVPNTDLTSQQIQEIDLLRLPDSLRKTMIAMTKVKEADAEQVAKMTDRTRGLESLYLNQLERMGYIERLKKGKAVYFRSLRII